MATNDDAFTRHLTEQALREALTRGARRRGTGYVTYAPGQVALTDYDAIVAALLPRVLSLLAEARTQAVRDRAEQMFHHPSWRGLHRVDD